VARASDSISSFFEQLINKAKELERAIIETDEVLEAEERELEREVIAVRFDHAVSSVRLFVRLYIDYIAFYWVQIEATVSGYTKEVEQIEEKIKEDKLLVEEGKEEVARLEVCGWVILNHHRRHIGLFALILGFGLRRLSRNSSSLRKKSLRSSRKKR